MCFPKVSRSVGASLPLWFYISLRSNIRINGACAECYEKVVAVYFRVFVPVSVSLFSCVSLGYFAKVKSHIQRHQTKRIYFYNTKKAKKKKENEKRNF